MPNPKLSSLRKHKVVHNAYEPDDVDETLFKLEADLVESHRRAAEWKKQALCYKKQGEMFLAGRTAFAKDVTKLSEALREVQEMLVLQENHQHIDAFITETLDEID